MLKFNEALAIRKVSILTAYNVAIILLDFCDN